MLKLKQVSVGDIMNKFETKYFNTQDLMNEALISLLETKDFEYITVKDICAKAGVNRSTFYLHYESLNDLLLESSTYITHIFYDCFNKTINNLINTNELDKYNIDDLYLLTDKYLIPYLSFIKENKTFYKTIIKNSYVLRLNETYNSMFKNIFTPILDRFQIDKDKREYILAYFINGIMAIVSVWLKNDCAKSIDEIIEIINICIKNL